MARRRRGERTISQTETRKYQLRERKERHDRQMLFAVLGPVLVFVVVVLVYGVYTELYMKPRTPVARVEGVSISADEFVSRVSWMRPQLISELNTFMQFASASDSSFLTNYAEGRRSSLPEDARTQLIDDVLVRQELESREIEVADADVDQRIREDLEGIIAPPESDEPLVIATAGAEGTRAITETVEITATATVIPTQEIGSAFQRYVVDGILRQAEMSVNEYRERVVKPQVAREKLAEALGDELPTSERQVEAANLRFTSEETAEKALAAFTDGASWAEVLEQFGPREEEGTEADSGEADMAAQDEEPTDSPEAADETDESGDEDLGKEDASDLEDASGEAEALEDEDTTQLVESGALTDTGELTMTGEVADAAELTTTLELTPTVAPAPTPTPDPFAFAFDESEWKTMSGIVDGWGFAQEAADEVFALEPFACAGPFSVGGATWYVVCVFDVDEDREIDPDELEQRRDSVLEDWLEERRLAAAIDKFPLEGLEPPEPPWFVQSMLEFVQPQPTVDLSSLRIGTAEPGDDAQSGDGAQVDDADGSAEDAVEDQSAEEPVPSGDGATSDDAGGKGAPTAGEEAGNEGS